MDPADPVCLLNGRYRLSLVVGRGGMGAVWRARDESLDRDVAVKEIVWPPYLSDAERAAARHRAVREARMAARLRHPNVVGVYDIFEEDGRPWIVMELLPYRSLRDVVREDGPLAPARAAQVGLGILAALRAAHAQGIVHRDVKPANILLCPDGRPVLTDFGIARAADSPAVTDSGVLIGSPSYIAPERARGGPAGIAGDLWGLGASLYMAVEGRPPFGRNGTLQSLTAVVTDEPDPATHAGPLWPVISGLLRKDPDRRLGAAEAGRMLRRAAAGGGAGRAAAAPAPAEPRELTTPPACHPRTAVGALATAAAVIAVAATALALAPGDAPRHSAVSTAASPRQSARSSPAADQRPSVRPVSARMSSTPASVATAPPSLDRKLAGTASPAHASPIARHGTDHGAPPARGHGHDRPPDSPGRRHHGHGA